MKIAKQNLKIMKKNLKNKKKIKPIKKDQLVLLEQENKYNAQRIRRMDLLIKKYDSLNKIKSIRSDTWSKEMNLAYEELENKINKEIDEEILNQLIN